MSLASRLTTKFGNLATFAVPTSKTYDAATGRVTQGTPTLTTIPVGGPFGYNQQLIDGLQIQERDQYLIIAADLLGFEPVPGETTIDTSGATYAVISVNVIESDDAVLAYKVQIR